jgi:hypothetical protein
MAAALIFIALFFRVLSPDGSAGTAETAKTAETYWSFAFSADSAVSSGRGTV